MSSSITKAELTRALGRLEASGRMQRLLGPKRLDRCLICAVEVTEGELYCEACGETRDGRACDVCGAEIEVLLGRCAGCAQEHATSEWADLEHDRRKRQR